MQLQNLLDVFRDNGCKKVYIKRLSPNDNSKNQVYLAGNFEILNILPISTIEKESAGEWERERFKALLPFSWIGDDGRIYEAPRSKLILYPKYPEVRFSGFLQSCEKAPSEIMTQRENGRLLFFSVTSSRKVIGYAAANDSLIAMQLNETPLQDEFGVFLVLDLFRDGDNKSELLKELKRINGLGWIESKRLDRIKGLVSCQSANCGGYTLEAELGITPNGYAEPDYLGWEIKQFQVNNFDKLNSAVITLMTPEPTGGMYVKEGVENFVRTYGYPDLSGKVDRINFGGRYLYQKRYSRTGLTLKLDGYDPKENKIRRVNGMIALIDANDNIAASWGFDEMILHWSRKHHQACYVPSQRDKVPSLRYRFGSKILLGTGTDFLLFLAQIASGNVYYDPAIKIENASTHPKTKRRSQFRVKSEFLFNLYHQMSKVDLDKYS